jgi:hypothetical protein
VQPAALPSGLRTTRVIAYVQGALLVLRGALLIFGGAAYATALNLQASGGAALFVSVGVVVVIVAALVIWSGVLLGRLSRRARYGLLAFEYLSIIFGILSLTDFLQATLSVVLAAVAIYYLQFNAETKAAFAVPRLTP